MFPDDDPGPALDRCPDRPFRRTHCLDLGLTEDVVDRLVRSRHLHQPMRGILHRADAPDSLAFRAAVAALALPPGAALARTTAAWLYGIDCRPLGEHDRIPDVECVVPTPSGVVRRPGVRCHQADLAAVDLTEVNGLPVTTPARTAIDLARYAMPGNGLGALDAMARAGLVEPGELLLMVERWRGERFVARARQLIGWCDPLAESFGESWLRLRVLDAGFPRPQLQIPLVDGDGVLVYRLDLGFLEVRAAFEYDGEEFHSGPEAERSDRRRRADIERRWGWTAVGVGKALVLGPSMALERAVGEALSLEPAIRRRLW